MFHPACDLQRTEQILIPVPVNVHTLQHAGQLAFQDGYRRFQLMGSGGEKSHPLPFLLPFPLHLTAKRLIGGLQFLQRG